MFTDMDDILIALLDIVLQPPHRNPATMSKILWH